MGNETQPSGQPLREAAAAAVAPDSVTAGLLAKHAAYKQGVGEKPSQAEFGKIGAFKARLKSVFVGKGVKVTEGAMAPAQASSDSVASVPVDSGLAVRTTAAVLRRCNAITVRWIEAEARKAGAAGQTLDRFRTAAALTADDQQLIAELSPDILAEMGVDVRKFPIITAAAVLGLHGTNLWLAVDELRELRKERDAATADRLQAEDRAAREARSKIQAPAPSGLMESLATVQAPQPPASSPPAAIPAGEPKK